MAAAQGGVGARAAAAAGPTTAHIRAAAEKAALGLLPQSSLSSHLRGSSLFLSSNDS